MKDAGLGITGREGSLPCHGWLCVVARSAKSERVSTGGLAALRGQWQGSTGGAGAALLKGTCVGELESSWDSGWQLDGAMTLRRGLRLWRGGG